MALGGAIAVGKFAWRYRKYIYRTLVAQDKAISSAFTKGGYSKWTTAGVRHGALAGSVIGSIITNPFGNNDNGFSTPKYVPKTGGFSKAYSGFARRYTPKRKTKCYPSRLSRKSYFSSSR